MQGKRVLMVGDRSDDMRQAQGRLRAGRRRGALYGYGSREELAPFRTRSSWPTDCTELTEWILRPVDAAFPFLNERNRVYESKNAIGKRII